MGTSSSLDKLNADVGVPVPPDSEKSERFQDLVNVIFETPNPLEELTDVAVNDSHGAAEDIADVVKDINDGMYSLNVDHVDGSLQLSVTQSQSVDGTEPVTQAEDVPMQLQLKDERIRKKKCDFQRRKELEQRQKAACVQRSDRDVAQAPEGVGDEGGDAAFSTVDAGSHGSDMHVKTNLLQTRLTQVFTRDAVKEKKVVLKRKLSDRNPDGTQRRTPRVKAGSQPERSLLKENNKRKVHPAKVNKGVKKHARVEAEDIVSEEDDIEVDSEDEFAVPVSVMSPVKPVGCNAGKVALDEAGFGSIFNWRVKSNISRPLMGVLYLRIDPDTMTLDMGEANKKLRITSDGIQQLFGFPRGGHSPPRPSEDGYDDALMKLRPELNISRNIDIKTKDLRNKLKVLVKDPSKDDLALKVFFIIVFMKLMVDELRRVVVRYQDGVTMGKAITGCAIGPVLMYLDCLIRGKTAEPDTRFPRICFMDPVKLSDLVDADLIKKGNADPKTWVFRKLPYKRPVLEMSSSQVPKSSYLHGELRGGRGVEGAGYVPPGPSNASTSQRQGFGIDVVVSALERAEHIFRNVCSGLQKVPTTVERMSCISGILPEGHQFDAEEAVDYIEMERILIGDMCDGAVDLVQSLVHLLNNMKRFKSMQYSCCKPYEESAKVVIRQIEQDEAATTDSRAGDGTEANVPGHETNDVGLERVVDDIEQDEAAATDSRADDGTEVNVSDHHTNDVGLEQPVVDETSHNVDAVVDRGVNDPSTNKCKGAVVGDEPCSPVGDVAFNVSNSKIDDVFVNASKMTDVDREAVVSGGDDAHGVPLSSGHDVGAKVSDEDFGVASILDGKPSGVGIVGNENLSDFEDLPPENFPPGGLDYGDALQDASSMDEELPSSSNTNSAESGNVVKVDMFFFAVTRLRKNSAKCDKSMFQNKEYDASVGSIAKAFVPTGMLNSDSADVVLYSLCQKYRDTDKLIVPRWVMTKIRDGNIDSNVLNWFTRSCADGFDQLLFPSFDPPSIAATMKPSEESGHWCLIVLNLRFRRFECLDSLRDETWSDAVIFLRNMTDNIKKVWRESSVDRAKPFSPAHIDGFSCEFVRVPQQKNMHDCGFFRLQSCKSYHCREDGVIEMLDYSHEDILDIRKTFLYTCATSDVFDVDFRGLFGIEPCEWLDLNEQDYRIFGSQFSELERVSIDLSQWHSPEKTRSSVLKGRLGALKGSTAACAENPSTPKNPIVELIDSDDDAFDKIVGMGRVTRSAAAAKGLSPLAGIVARRAGGARKDPALDSGNVTSMKRAPRAPIKFCSPMQQLQPHRFPHLDKARKLYNLLLSDEACEKYADNTFSMTPQPDGSVSSFTGKRIWEVFAPGQMMEGDIMDFLIDDWKKDPDRNVDFASGKRVLLSPYFITLVLDCTFYGDENKEFNVKSVARDFKSYVKDNEDLLSADLIMMPLFKPMVLPKDKKVNHFSLYVMNRYRSSVDILDPLPYPKNHRPSKNTYHKDCEKIISMMVQVMKDVYGDAQYNASKQPKWELFAKKPMFVKVPLQGANECGHYTLKYAGSYDGEKIVGNIRDKDPRIVDWKAEDLYRVVFNRNNQLLVMELPKEFQPLAPGA
ncbi:hypothetical protein VPH35_086700 [Triticum aestivum]